MDMASQFSKFDYMMKKLCTETSDRLKCTRTADCHFNLLRGKVSRKVSCDVLFMVLALVLFFPHLFALSSPQLYTHRRHHIYHHIHQYHTEYHRQHHLSIDSHCLFDASSL